MAKRKGFKPGDRVQLKKVYRDHGGTDVVPGRLGTVTRLRDELILVRLDGQGVARSWHPMFWEKAAPVEVEDVSRK